MPLTPDLIKAAQASQAKYKVPASVTLAQFALESSWGTRMPIGSNNPFGIKAVGDQPYVTAKTREVIGGKSVMVIAKFRKFANFSEAFDAHAVLLSSKQIYAPAMKAWLSGNLVLGVSLMAKKYATDPIYAKTLLDTISGYNLTQYDRLPAPVTPAPAGPNIYPQSITPSVNWFVTLLNLLIELFRRK